MASASTLYKIPATLHAPYTMQTALTLERQLTKISTLSVTYLNSRGVHQLLSNQFFPNSGTQYQYQSDGVFKQNQLIVNINVRAGSKIALFGYYVLNYANSDASGANSFQSNPSDLFQDYGRASFDTRNRIFLGGSILLPYALRVSPFLIASSGRPFNVTVPTNPLVTTVLNQRPNLVSTATCPGNPPPTSNFGGTMNIFCTPLGTFNDFNGETTPVSGYDPIPINNFTGPNYFSLNLRISKSFGFGSPRQGPGGRVAGGGEGGGGRRGPGGNIWGGGGGSGGESGNDTNHPHAVTFSINARNIFNNVNLASPIGVLGSSRFDQSISLATPPGGAGGGGGPSAAANRLIYLQASFDF